MDKLTRSLIDKIGPVDIESVIAASPEKTKDGIKHLIKLGNRRINDGEAQNLQHEAETIVQMGIYKILVETLRYQAQRRMFEESKTWEDMITGKMLLHAISTFEYIIAACKDPLLVIHTQPPKPVDRRVPRERN